MIGIASVGELAMRCAAMFGLAVAGVILLGCAPRAPAAAGFPNTAESCRFWSDKTQAKTFDNLAAMPEPVWRGMAKLLAPDLKPESLPAALPRIITAQKANGRPPTS